MCNYILSVCNAQTLWVKIKLMLRTARHKHINDNSSGNILSKLIATKQQNTGLQPDYAVTTVQFCSVSENNVSCSPIIKIMPAALTHSSYIETFQFSASQGTVRVSVMSSYCILFHANGPATEKLCGLKLAVVVRNTTRSPWFDKRKWQHVETAETGLIIDTRYGAPSWWRHLYTSRQILKYDVLHGYRAGLPTVHKLTDSP